MNDRPDMHQLPDPEPPRRPYLAPAPVAAVALAVCVILATIMAGRLFP